MLKDLRIRNYRALGEFEIGGMAPVNVLTGANNSGKTTLLEALFLLSGAGNPHMALNANVTRGIDLPAVSVLPETLWPPIFTALDTTRTIEIGAKHESAGRLALNIAFERSPSFELPLDGPDIASDQPLSSESALLFSFRKDSGEMTEGRIRGAGGRLRIDQPDSRPPFPAIFLSSRIGNVREDAMRLGQLRKRKLGELVLDALRIVEPRLRSVEDNSASGHPMIWGDVGLSELLPLPAMGEGMTRIARLVLAISAAPDGVVLVDEIENGFHHTVLEKVWRAVDTAARQFDTQVVASTHSFECLEAAQHALGPDRLAVHRLETAGDGIRCVTYGPDAIEAAVSHGLEVR